MQEERTYIRRDEHGVLRVAQSRVMLDSVLAAWEDGHSPETIRSQFPALSLEEVYGAITWCLSHPGELAEYMKIQNAVWEEQHARAESRNDELRQRLRAAKGLTQNG